MTVRVKICGLKSESEIIMINETRPEYVGFIFESRSKKFIAPEHAAFLKSKLRRGIQTVGVFVDEPIELVADCAKTAGLDFIQLHGNENENYITLLRNQTQCKIIRAVRVGRLIDLERAMRSAADLLLVAGPKPGEKFDWSLISYIRRPYFMSGGLTPENVQSALDLRPQPYAVDVCSGVESHRLKDYKKMMKFIYNVRTYKDKNL